MSKLFASFAFFILCYLSAFSQTQPFITLKGRIVNINNGEGIAYAGLHVTSTGIGTISNERGRFIFKIPIANKNDSIHITHLSYRPYSFVLSGSDTGFITIQLKEKVNQLNEVVVKAINPLELLNKAIANVPKNYPTKPYLITGFYRLTGWKEKNIMDISEAVFQIYNKTYAVEGKRFKLIKSRLDKDLTAFNGNDGVNFGTTPGGIVSSDIVSHISESELLSKKGLKDHRFVLEGVISYNGVEAYEILYDQKDDIKESLFKGRIILDADNLAFLEVEINRSPKGIGYWEFKNIMLKLNLRLANISATMLESGGVITYRKFGNKYYIDRENGAGAWRIVGGRKQFSLDPLRFKSDYIITNIDTVNINFDKEAVAVNGKILESHSADINTDSTDRFWTNYNTIQAVYNIDSAAKIIRSRNATRSFKRELAPKLRKYKNDKIIRIDSILNFYHRKEQFNGTALVTYKGKVIYEKAFGLADKEKRIPNAINTQFRIGSTSKQFTTMLIMQLANEGKLSVTDSAGKFIPRFRNGKVSIDQLMTHRSGIPNYTENEKYLSMILNKKYSTDELVKNFCSDPLEFEPGTQFHYSNSGYVVLATIIEKITGKKFSDVLAERIFVPAGMKNSFFSVRKTSTLATGYVSDQPEMTYPIENTIGAGAITSTVEDLLQWNNALTANTLLPKEKTNELFQPRVEWKEYDASYGYGWMIDKLMFTASKKHGVQYHPGTEVGFYTMLVRQPDNGVFIILLNNTGDFPRFDMTDLILNELD